MPTVGNTEWQLMAEITKPVLIAAVLLAAAASASVMAQGKIVCWKDASGKVVGCGDRVPPEYQENATKELDKRGVTRKTTDSVDEAARRRVQSEEASRAQAERDKRLAEQRRQDSALLATYASEHEIDVKRDRDLQAVELNLNQLRAAHKNAGERHKDAKVRLDAAEKAKKGPMDAMKEDLTRAADESRRLEQSIAAKEKEKDDIRARYAEYRRRYAELKGPNPKK